MSKDPSDTQVSYCRSGLGGGMTSEEEAVLRKWGFKADVAYVPVTYAPISEPTELRSEEDWEDLVAHVVRCVTQNLPLGLAGRQVTVYSVDDLGRSRIKMELWYPRVIRHPAPDDESVLLRHVVPCAECLWWDQYVVDGEPHETGECELAAVVADGALSHPESMATANAPGEAGLTTTSGFWCAQGKPVHEHHWQDITMHEQARPHYICDVEGCGATKKEARDVE